VPVSQTPSRAQIKGFRVKGDSDFGPWMPVLANHVSSWAYPGPGGAGGRGGGPLARPDVTVTRSRTVTVAPPLHGGRGPIQGTETMVP
jgi:hypothetical protein